MLELEGHVDLTIRKQLSKQTWQGRCQEEGIPARVSEVATTLNEYRVMQFQGLGEVKNK